MHSLNKDRIEGRLTWWLTLPVWDGSFFLKQADYCEWWDSLQGKLKNTTSLTILIKSCDMQCVETMRY